MRSRTAVRTDASAVPRRQNVVSKERLDQWLDDALADTFPASDPVASPPSDAAPQPTIVNVPESYAVVVANGSVARLVTGPARRISAQSLPFPL